jgi:uncharacterized protein YbjT (DUF2867 family)
MIAIVGATGHIGGKIADLLNKKGERVRIIARSGEALRRLASKTVEAYNGDALDTDFLIKAFTGVDAVFSLIPPDAKASPFLAYADKIGESIARAIVKAKVKHVVNLSSIGAELPDGTGPITGLHRHEERLNRIDGLNVLHVRAGYFMENLLVNVDLIKAKGITGSALRGDVRIPMIATRDIAEYIADRLTRKDFAGASVKYLLGERDLTMIEATGIIGRKIGKPDLNYIMFPYDNAEQAMVSMGFSQDMAGTYIEMTKAFNDGNIVTEKRSEQNSTGTTIEEFCDLVLVPLYVQKKAA